ncbi:hypothetical protein QOT72_25750, partial [Pseudomonas aeruginosa]
SSLITTVEKVIGKQRLSALVHDSFPELQRFRAQVRADRLNVAALATLGAGQLALFSTQGVLKQDL